MPVAINTITITSLPPTVNSLDASQRARLLKSTRKLADILGTTPYILDSDSTPLSPSREKCEGSHLYLSPSTAVTTNKRSAESRGSALCTLIPGQPSNTLAVDIEPQLERLRRRKSAQLVRPPVLCLRQGSSALHIETNFIPQQSSACLIPASPSSAQKPSSPVPASAQDPSTILCDETKMRRKRMSMSKLTRTLGESIPTEIIFPKHPSDALRSSQERDGHKSGSVETSLSEDAFGSSPSFIASHAAGGYRGTSINSVAPSGKKSVLKTSPSTLLRSASTIQRSKRRMVHQGSEEVQKLIDSIKYCF